jgi:arginyl-tRNA synthetase
VVKRTIEKLTLEVIRNMGLEAHDFVVEHPTSLENGDYSTNAAMVLAKPLGKNPKELAEEIAAVLRQTKNDFIDEIKVAGPGFVNFYLSKDFFKKSIGEIVEKGEGFGKNSNLKGEKTIVEYTDPNPFKEFHIGHLMSNTIGEAVSRIIEWNGAEVKRACYQGDVGMHVAKAVWGIMKGESDPYPAGAKAYEENEQAKEEIQRINKEIYEGDAEVRKIWEKGRQESLDEFEKIYKKLGTKFDYFFFESETGKVGKKIVEENEGRVFEESDGAVVFKAEKYNPSLHTRVFINSEGLPTYEAKELGLAPTKYEKYPYDKSIVVTGNEVNGYFQVILEAMKQVLPELRKKTEHVSHGMLRLPTGKMSSRTGDVITAEELIGQVKEKTEGNEAVAIGAIKYMILRQQTGGDIIFDLEKSVSTEGDSGVYLQYAYARSNSILEKAGRRGDASGKRQEMHEVEKLLYRFPEVVERALQGYAPNLVTTYLTELAGAFNNFYAHEQVLGDSSESGYRLAIVEAFNAVMKNGLNVLGIPAPEKI